MSKSLTVALPLLLLLLAATDVGASVSQSISIGSARSRGQRAKIFRSPFAVSRGGATVTDEDEMNLDEEEEDDVDPVMVKAAIKSSYKVKQKKTATAKAKVSEKLASSAATKATPSKKKKSGSLWGKVPYIIRACLNPFTVIAMTRAYFVSLVNLNYLQEEKSQDLRSALEEKAKKSRSTNGGRTGKRQMKPGQAKTLSDLPQLNT